MTTLRRVLAGSTPFSYACAGCGRCCHDKRITLTPYEIARIADAAGIGTRELLERHTDEAGTVLRFDGPGGACTFFREGRCTVHEGRPLACRLYPLGRVVNENGRESYVELEPHPRTEGAYGEDSTVAAWAEAQGASPFIAWAARYHATFRSMVETIATRDGAGEAWSAALEPSEPTPDEWLDVDAVVARVACDRGEPEPDDVEARMELHARALAAWVDSLSESR